MQERRCRGDRSKSHEGPNVAHALDQLSTAQRSNHDTDPEACSDRTNLSRREALNSTANAQECALQRIAHLHESETQEECKQSRQGSPLRGLHSWLRFGWSDSQTRRAQDLKFFTHMPHPTTGSESKHRGKPLLKLDPCSSSAGWVSRIATKSMLFPGTALGSSDADRDSSVF